MISNKKVNFEKLKDDATIFVKNKIGNDVNSEKFSERIKKGVKYQKITGITSLILAIIFTTGGIIPLGIIAVVIAFFMLRRVDEKNYIEFYDRIFDEKFSKTQLDLYMERANFLLDSNVGDFEIERIKICQESGRNYKKAIRKIAKKYLIPNKCDGLLNIKTQTVTETEVSGGRNSVSSETFEWTEVTAEAFRFL